MTVQSGPFQGLVGLATPYRMTATARLADRSEASLTRTLQTVAIPVFQFGIFSENDLSFFAGPNFNFGGRVHSNSNVFLASGNGSTLTLSDRITTVGEIVRTHLSNGWDNTTNYTGIVNVLRAPGTFRALLPAEGSLVTTLGSAVNEPTWTNLSTGTYNHNITNSRTGARRLDLPIINFGNGPIDLIKRPVAGEDVTNANLLSLRFYSLASVRILLSDTAAEITSLPGIDNTVAPVQLGIVEPYVVSASGTVPALLPFAQSPGTATAGVFTPTDTPLLGGFIKIEKQTALGTWQDATLEVLSYGISAPQLNSSATGSAGCTAQMTSVNPNAIVRLQRPWDNAGACYSVANLTGTTNTVARRYIPLSLYDPREALLRDTAPATMQMGGIMHYVEIDARNLSRWLEGSLPGCGTCGTNALRDGAAGGFTVYFSDRRSNKNGAGAETGEYGLEDIINPTVGSGAPDGVLHAAEDVNGSTTLEMYGQLPQLGALTGGVYTAALRPWSSIGAANPIETARRNPPAFFRRALKLTNGATNLIAPGLTISSENPVYLQGNWNANGNFTGAHVATSILADAVTLLSNNWNDRNSFVNPHAKDTASQRNATDTWYRVAIISGKGLSFAQPAGTNQDYGTDGGAHNFLRYIEDWGGQTLNYRGAIASLYISRQAIGTYKCCNTVYSPPTRGYNFDVEFLTPALLPPRTPMFRDVNITGFAQLIRAQ